MLIGLSKSRPGYAVMGLTQEQYAFWNNVYFHYKEDLTTALVEQPSPEAEGYTRFSALTAVREIFIALEEQKLKEACSVHFTAGSIEPLKHLLSEYTEAIELKVDETLDELEPENFEAMFNLDMYNFDIYTAKRYIDSITYFLSKIG